MTDAAAERLREFLRFVGWTFLGQVGSYRYWRRHGGGWLTEEQAFAYVLRRLGGSVPCN